MCIAVQIRLKVLSPTALPVSGSPWAVGVRMASSGATSRSTALAALFLHLNKPARFPTLERATAHVRERRGLHPDEWLSAPKPALLEAAARAAGKLSKLKATPGG